MIMLKNYTSIICDKFEESNIKLNKIEDEEKKISEYGNIYLEFEEIVTKTMEKLIDDIQKELIIKVDKKNYL